MAEPVIGAGIRTVWIVWHDDRPPDGGHAQFLAVYDGDQAEASAKALVELIERINVSGRVQASPAPVWPLLQMEN